MMGLLASLGRFFWRTESHPPQIAGDFAPDGLDVEDSEEMLVSIEVTIDEPSETRARQRAGVAAMPGAERIDDDLFGITFAIEYSDSKGFLSHRRVTLRDVWRAEDGRTYLRCFCHERNAPRTFRFDRVRNIIDMDGEIHDPGAFFADELKVNLPTDGPALSASASEGSPAAQHPTPVTTPQAEPHGDIGNGAPTARGEKPGIAQRRVARDGVRVLVGLARSDGELHPAERDAILEYIAGRCERAGVPIDDEDRAALTSYLKRNHPTADVLQQCLERLDNEPEVEQRYFAAAALALAAADGVEDEAELAMLRAIGVVPDW